MNLPKINIIYFALLVFYSVIPPLVLFFTQRLIYKTKHKYSIHLHYLAKYLLTLSFLPILFLPEVDLGINPKNNLSITFLIATFILSVLGLQRAIKKNTLFFYIGGVFAAFMEELLYRGIIFGLAYAIWGNQWLVVVVSSLSFGVWHLKNYYWLGGKSMSIQFLYTTIIHGPFFSLMRIYTGDIYIAVLFHYIIDAACSLAPDWMRGWLVMGGKGRRYSDHIILKS